MAEQMRNALISLAVIFAALANHGAQAAETPQGGSAVNPPAGQVCPPGSFVIGFDAESNILCSGICGNGVLDSGEACDDGNTVAGDGCSASCRFESPAGAGQQAGVTAVPPPASTPTPPAPPAPAPAAAPAAVQLALADVEPSSAVYGVREVTVAISGSGFTGDTTVLFNGQTYTPTVNPAGTELRVTLATRGLAIGRYAITVSDGAERTATLKKGLEIF
jgi:cysteine-rich repeat protein